MHCRVGLLVVSVADVAAAALIDVTRVVVIVVVRVRVMLTDVIVTVCVNVTVVRTAIGAIAYSAAGVIVTG